MMSISLIDDVVKGSHIIYHSNKDNLESEGAAMNNYARTLGSRTVAGKLACVVPFVVSLGSRPMYNVYHIGTMWVKQ